MLPINHTIIIKNSILEAHAGVAMSLYRAFQEAKASTYERLNYLRRSSLIFSGLYLEEERELFGDDPYPYGLEANRCVLETLIDYSHEQENSSRRTLFLLEPRTTVRNMRLLPRR